MSHSPTFTPSGEATWGGALAARVLPALAHRPHDGPFPAYRWGAGAPRRRWVRRSLLRLWNRLDRPIVVPWRKGLRLWLRPRDETCWLIFLTGCYEPNELHWMQSVLRPGMTVLDVGGNLGLFTLVAAQAVGPGGRVLTVEPSEREREMLAANVALNELSQVTLAATAVSDHTGEATFRIARAPHLGQNTLGGFVYQTQEARQVTVPLTTLDDLVAQHGLTRVDFLKLDVEGAEVHALRGAADLLRRHRPMVLMEINDQTLAYQGASSAQVRALLEAHHYSFRGLDPQTGEPAPFVWQDHYADTVNLIALPPPELDRRLG